jgi:hypothetical protein
MGCTTGDHSTYREGRRGGEKKESGRKKCVCMYLTSSEE